METKDPNLVKEPINNRNRDTNSAVDSETHTNKGTETLKNDTIESEHVNDGDNPARQPDPRDQQGQTPFDGNVNATTLSTKTEQVDGDEITDENRYATIDNAQKRVLNDDLK